MTDLAAQVAALTAKLAKPLTLEDLPLADLRSKLIDNGEPLDLSVLALAGQVADFGGVYPHIRTGVTAIAIVANNNGAATVTHGLVDGSGTGLTPLLVLVSTDQLDWFASANAYGTTTFGAQVRQYQGVNVSLTVNVSWIAIA